METPNPAASPATHTSLHRAHVLVFTSGKGGVGKTCITTNVAAAMAQRGSRVCIFDADTGLANINILLGLRPEFTLEHVLNGEKSIHEIVLKTAQGVAVVPGASGIAECANLDAAKVARLCLALTELEAEYDYFLIDTAAGIADSVLQFIESAPFTFLVITSEPTSLTDAFSLLKLLNARNYSGRVRVVVNLANDYPAATETYRRFVTAVDKYLSLSVEYGGFIARDDHVPKSVALQMPVIDLAGSSPASRCLYALADNVLKYIGAEEAETGLADFWNNLLADTATAQEELPELVAQTTGEPASQMTVELSFSQLSDSLLLAVQNRSADAEQLDNLITDLAAKHLEQYGRFPAALQPLLFRWLEAEDYPATQLLELTTTLEALYMARHQQPLFSLEGAAARLVAQCQGSETRLRDIVQHLRAAYRQSFKQDVFDAQQEILDSIQKADFTEEQFEQLLLQQRLAFEKRFNRSYKGQSEMLLESSTHVLTAISKDEEKLQLEITRLSENFQQLSLRRDALLRTLNNQQTSPNQSLTVDD